MPCYISKILSNNQKLGGVSVIILSKDGSSILCGIRDDNGQIGGAGGHIEPGETPRQAAIRETQEEFGILLINMKYLGRLNGDDPAHVFYCTEYTGKLVESDEMTNLMWLPSEKIALGRTMGKDVFAPFQKSIQQFRR